MKAYRSRRSFDTEPVIKAARATIERDAIEDSNVPVEPEPDPNACATCGKPGDWYYAGSGPTYCEEHVNRARCSCHADWPEYEFDEQGRRNPCVDYNWVGPTECFKPAPCTTKYKCMVHAKCVCGDVGYYYQFPAGYFSSPESELPHTDEEWEKFKVPCKDCG